VFVYRIVEVASVWAIVSLGVGIRYEMRRTGWSAFPPARDDDGNRRTGKDLPPMAS
jgi:hypothetical protein